MKRYGVNTHTQEDELIHYGVKGQAWGIRRFQNSDGSLTELGIARYRTSDGGLTKKGKKLYSKETKKLNKLRDRADIDLQRKNVEKYDARAGKAAKVAAVGIGSMIGGAASLGLGNVLQQKAYGKFNKTLRDAYQQYTAPSMRVSALRVYPNDGARKSYSNAVNKTNENLRKFKSGKSRADTFAWAAQVVGAAVTAGALGVAGYNKVQSIYAKNRTTAAGHEKAVAKYETQVNKMMEMFKDTPCADLIGK